MNPPHIPVPSSSRPRGCSGAAQATLASRAEPTTLIAAIDHSFPPGCAVKRGELETAWRKPPPAAAPTATAARSMPRPVLLSAASTQQQARSSRHAAGTAPFSYRLSRIWSRQLSCRLQPGNTGMADSDSTSSSRGQPEQAFVAPRARRLARARPRARARFSDTGHTL